MYKINALLYSKYVVKYFKKNSLYLENHIYLNFFRLNEDINL